MATDYEILLDATIQHLESLKSRGVRQVAVSPVTMRALTLPAPRNPSSLAVEVSKPPVPSGLDAKPPAHPKLNLLGSTEEYLLPRPTRNETTAAPAPRDPEARTAAIAELRTRALACVKCPNLAAARKTVVFGVGNLNADLMFVGEAPGADEDEQGEPFVGRAGQLLTKIIETMGLQRSEVYIANILKCRPDTPGQSAGNRKPTPEEMKTCIPYLHEQIDLIQPSVLVALGGTALEGLLNKSGITKLRGQWHDYRGIPLMPTYHPSYLLRYQTLVEKRRVWEDMLQVMEKLGLPISEKQRRFFLGK